MTWLHIDEMGIVHPPADPIPVPNEAVNFYLGELDRLGPADALLDPLRLKEIAHDALVRRVIRLQDQLQKIANDQAGFVRDATATIERLNNRLTLAESRARALGFCLARHVLEQGLSYNDYNWLANAFPHSPGPGSDVSPSEAPR